MSKWIKVKGHHNEALLSDDESFFISYNPNTAIARSEVTEAAQLLGTLAGLDMRDGEETALVKVDGGGKGVHTYSILKGDFRKQYEYLMDEGYEACLKFYNQHKDEYGSDWSTRE